MQSGSGSGQAGDLLVERVGCEAAPLGQWLVIRVAITAMKQDNVAGDEWPMLFLPGDDSFLFDKLALAGESTIAQVAALDDACLAAELPGRNHVRVSPPERARVGK